MMQSNRRFIILNRLLSETSQLSVTIDVVDSHSQLLFFILVLTWSSHDPSEETSHEGGLWIEPHCFPTLVCNRQKTFVGASVQIWGGQGSNFKYLQTYFWVFVFALFNYYFTFINACSWLSLFNGAFIYWFYGLVLKNILGPHPGDDLVSLLADCSSLLMGRGPD